MSFLRNLSERVSALAGFAADDGAIEPTDTRLPIAALLVHVARADGRYDDAERARLIQLLTERFGWDRRAAERLAGLGDDLDRGVDDIATLIDMTGHSLDQTARASLIATAYEVAAADGRIGEFEDDLVWRLGHLLGFPDEEIEAIRTRTVSAALGGG
jgi:uncharacterized tellurite resistance protein B-like protein